MPYTHHHRKRKHSTLTRLERFLTSSFFRVLGIALVAAGVIYLSSSSKSFDWLRQLITGLISASEDKPKTDLGGGNLVKLVALFVPVILTLGFSAIFAKKAGRITYFAVLLSIVYLIGMQFLNIGNVFSSMFLAILFLATTIALLFLNNTYHKKPGILILTILYFYLSIVFLALHFGWLLVYLIPSIIVFGGAVSWSAVKIQKSGPALLNLTMTIGVFGLFWLRKFVINSKTDFLADFFIYGGLLYVFLFIYTGYVSVSLKEVMRKWQQPLLVWLKLAFYGGTTAYVILKYYSAENLWIPVLALLLFTVGSIFLIRKLAPTLRQSPYLFSAILLATLLFPLLFSQNKLLVFMAVFSTSLMYYAWYSGERIYVFASFAAMGIMLANYLYHWGFIYFPTLLMGKVLPDGMIILHGAVGGVIASAAFEGNRWLLDKSELGKGPKWFTKHQSLRVIRALLLFTLFTAISWMGITTSVHLTKSIEIVPIAWFISGALFFISLMAVQSGGTSVFKNPIRYLALAFCLIYPFLVQQSMVSIRANLPVEIHLYKQGYLFHLLALLLLIVMGGMAIPRIYRKFIRNVFVRRAMPVITLLFLLFLIPAEFDSLTVFLGISNGSLQTTPAIESLLNLNLHLPFSIILSIITLSFLIWATLKHLRFMRRFTIGLLLIILIKIFAFDFVTLSSETRTAVLITIGILLIGFSFIYPRMVKNVSESLVKEHKSKKPNPQIPTDGFTNEHK